MDIKEEHSLSDDVVSQNETEFFTMKRNSDDVLIKSETPPIYFTKQIKCDTVTSSNSWEIDSKTEIEEKTLVSDLGSQNEAKFLPEIAVMNLGKYNNDHEIDNKIEIKQEPCWLEIETSFACDDKDGDLPPVTCLRLCTERVSGADSDKLPLSSVEVSGIDTSFCNGKDPLECERQKSDVAEMPTTQEHVLSEQSGKCIDRGEMYISPLYLNKKQLFQKGRRSHKCNICDQSYTRMSTLKRHNLIHVGKKPHQCKICDKRFIELSHLKRHNLTHEGKKPHECKICNRSFTQSSHLKTHNLIHDGKKPHQCKNCDKSFARLSDVKKHNLVHEGKKPHQCNICNKSFTHLSTLKAHNLIHEGKRPHQCKTCTKSFTQLSTLKNHTLIHEGRKPH